VHWLDNKVFDIIDVRCNYEVYVTKQIPLCHPELLTVLRFIS